MSGAAVTGQLDYAKDFMFKITLEDCTEIHFNGFSEIMDNVPNLDIVKFISYVGRSVSDCDHIVWYISKCLDTLNERLE